MKSETFNYNYRNFTIDYNLLNKQVIAAVMRMIGALIGR